MIDEFFSISLLNSSFIPPTYSKEIDAEIRITVLLIWSVPNSATKGIQGMQAISNLLISAWNPKAAHFDAQFQYFGVNSSLKCRRPTSLPGSFPWLWGGAPPSQEKDPGNEVGRRSRLAVAKMNALSLFLVWTISGQQQFRKRTFETTQKGEETPIESINVSCNSIEILRPRCNLDMYFLELHE